MTIRQALLIGACYALVLTTIAGCWSLSLLTSPPPFRTIEAMR